MRDEGTVPACAMTPQNRNFARNARINDPAGVREPNADSLDGRSAATEKSVQESRTTKPKATDGFAYRSGNEKAGVWVMASYDRVLRESWTPGMCKGL